MSHEGAPQIIGIPSYRKRDFERLRSQFEDGNKLHESWREWRKAARALIAGLRERGELVVEVVIDPEEFGTWCKEQGMPQNAEARLKFATRIARDEFLLHHHMSAGGDRLLSLARALSDEADRCTVPLFRWLENDDVEFEGSGILVQHAGRHALVTAAHVVDACVGGILVEKRAVLGHPLMGPVFCTNIPAGGTRADDNLDVAVVLLEQKEVEFFGTDRFLSLAHTVESTPEDEYFVAIVLGYAANDQVVSRDRISVKSTMFLTGFAEERGHRLAKVDRRRHVLLRYRRGSTLWNGSYNGMTPSLKGTSGCGVFHLQLQGERVGLPFVGIVVERPEAFAPSLLVTRGTIVRQMIESIVKKIGLP